MHFKDLASFTLEIEKKLPSICLIISKEETAADIFLKKWKKKLVRWEAAHFSSLELEQEAGNFTLFPEPILFYISNAEKLKDITLLVKYLKNPQEHHFLLSSTAPLSFFPKEAVVVQLTEEKPWQARKRVEEWLRQECMRLEITLPPLALKYLIDAIGLDTEALSQELDKLLNFIFPRREIRSEDIEKVVVAQPTTTLWELGEALFQNNTSLCFNRSKFLLDSGISIFTLLSHVRTQIRTLLEMHRVVEEEGVVGLQKAYPYLKGGILDKKIEEIKRNSPEKLHRALYLLFQHEIKAKNSSINPYLLLETLFVQVNDLIPTT